VAVKEFEEYKEVKKNSRYSAWKLSAPGSRRPGGSVTTPAS
jgi:hypothetical protein